MSIVPVLALSLFLAAPVPESNPGVLPLFADDPAYRAATAIESRFEGKLEFLPIPGGPGRYRLLVPEGVGKLQPYELHLPRAFADLATFVCQPVRVTGKLTDKGLWPGKIERRRVTGGPGRDGVLARSAWQPPMAQRIARQTRTYVLKSGDQVAGMLPLRGPTPGVAATELLARSLRVPEIDWNKQMVVCVALGLRTDIERLNITRAVAHAGVLTVYYRLQRPAAGMAIGFGYPAETALVPRYDGTVRFQEEAVP